MKIKLPIDWGIIELKELVDKKRSIRYGIVQPGDFDENGRFMVRGQDYSFGWVEPKNLFKVSDAVEAKYKNARLKTGDIVLTIVGAGTGTVAIVPDWLDGANCTQTTARIAVDNNKADSNYCYYFLSSGFGKKLTYQNIKGGAQPGLNCGDIEYFEIYLPPLSEQKAIAQVLSTADAVIQTNEKLITQKELRKKWLMQQLLTGKKRLKGFNNKIEFRVIGQYLNEVSERNKDSKVSNVLSVTNSRGFINQSDQFDRSVASEDASNYKIVRKGQFAYNPSRVNVGSLDLLRNFEIGILSPMYVVFETNKAHLLPEYFYFQLKTQWFYGHIPMFVQGSVRDSLSFDGLCSMKFFVPSLEEQTAIAQVLQAADKEISLLKAKAEKLKEQKKGFMQVLLTGKKRLI
jgi:type I restriction enzyme, S subunit